MTAEQHGSKTDRIEELPSRGSLEYEIAGLEAALREGARKGIEMPATESLLAQHRAELSRLRNGQPKEGVSVTMHRDDEIQEYQFSAPSPPSVEAGPSEPFQARVGLWMMACFGPEISKDRVERNHRFLEESLELVQALGCTRSEAHQLVDYTFDREAGQPDQEAGGVQVTHAAFCLANDLDMHEAGERELTRIWQKIDRIRAKQAAKPKHSPLPAGPEARRGEREALGRIVDDTLADIVRNGTAIDAETADETGLMLKPRLRATRQGNGGWLADMENAPHDGKPVWIRETDGRESVACWNEQFGWWDIVPDIACVTEVIAWAPILKPDAPSPPDTLAIPNARQSAHARFNAELGNAGKSIPEEVLARAFNTALSVYERLRRATPPSNPDGMRNCTCHPDDNPPRPCPQRYALSECRAAAQPDGVPADEIPSRVHFTENPDGSLKPHFSFPKALSVDDAINTVGLMHAAIGRNLALAAACPLHSAAQPDGVREALEAARPFVEQAYLSAASSVFKHCAEFRKKILDQIDAALTTLPSRTGLAK